MNRCAFTIAAGPTYSSSPQKIGHDVVHAAQRMHLVVSSNRARSSGDWRRSVSGSPLSFTKNGSTLLYPSKNGSMSTIRSFNTDNPRMGSTVAFGATSCTRTLQASAFRPLMSMASEPQMPWAHERRSASVPSCRHFTSWSASSSRSVGSICTVNSSHQGSSETSGL